MKVISYGSSERHHVLLEGITIPVVIRLGGENRTNIMKRHPGRIMYVATRTAISIERTKTTETL